MRIVIGEDEVLIAEHLSDILLSYNFDVVGMAHNKEEIIELIDNVRPDIAILDIRMKNKYDGIEIGEYLLKTHQIPFIYITAHSDIHTVEKAISTKPLGYIIKPFKPIDVYTTLRIAADSLNKRTGEKNFIFKDGFTSIKIPYSKILFFKSDGNYIEIQAEDKKYSIRSSLNKISEILNEDTFIQTHRSYMVNRQKIVALKKDSIVLPSFEVPVSRKYFAEIKRLFLII